MKLILRTLDSALALAIILAILIIAKAYLGTRWLAQRVPRSVDRTHHLA